MRSLAFALVIATAATAAGCGNGTAPATGTLRIHLRFAPVSQLAADTDGVGLAIDSRPPQHLNASFDSVVAVLATGPHVLTLSDVEPNCTTFGGNPQTVVVHRDSTILVLLGGICESP